MRSPATGRWSADPRLRAKLVEEAREEGVSMSATLNRVLCEAYRVEYRPTGRPGAASETADEMHVGLQADLDRKIRTAAAARDRTLQAEIIETLSRHYDLPVPARRAA